MLGLAIGYSPEIHSAESARLNLNVTEQEISWKFLCSLKREGTGKKFSPFSLDHSLFTRYLVCII